MSDFVYDYSWSRPDPAALGLGVMRYLCPPSNGTKRLTKPELTALHAAGKPVGLVWEATADSTSWDGAEADRQADALGFPDSTPIYFAQDAYVNSAAYDVVAERLAAQPTRRPKGLYAGAPLVQYVLDKGIATHGWIASALSWSMGPPYSVQRAITLAPGAHLMQLVGTDVPGTDMNTVLKPDWGGWHPDQGDDDMATAEEIAAAMWKHVQTAPGGDNPQEMGNLLWYTHDDLAALATKVAELEAEIAKISTASTGGAAAGDFTITGTLHAEGGGVG